MKELVTGDEAMVEALQARLKQAQTIAEFQRIQCVLLRAVLGLLGRPDRAGAGLGDGHRAHHALALGA